MKIYLLFPPIYPPTQPYLALPCLTAYLRSHGFDVVQRDLSAEFFDSLLTRRRLEAVLCRLRYRFDQLHERPSLQAEAFDAYWSLRLCGVEDQGLRWLARTGEALKSFTRDPAAFFDLDRYARYKQFLYQIQECVFHQLYGPRADQPALTTFTEETILDQIESLKHSALDQFAERACRSVAEDEPDLIGLSISAEDQIVPGLALAARLRATLEETHITIGGSIVSLWGEILLHCHRLFEVVDSAVLLEGERPLLELCRALHEKAPLSSVPNLIYRENGRLEMNAIGRPEDPQALPVPDFDGLPLDKYFSPHLVLPILASRGCYWGKCTFCTHSHVYGGRYRPDGVDHLVDALAHLASRHDTSLFTFSDEALTPGQCRRLSIRLLERGLRINWLADIRADTQFRPNDFELMARAGCKALYIGMESASPRILTKMRKGTTPAVVSRVTRLSSEAGLWNHIYAIVGFPTETAAEFEKTAAYLYAHSDRIDSVGVNTCAVGRHSHLYAHPLQYGITVNVPKSDSPDLTVWYDFTQAEGMSREEIEAAHQDLLQDLTKHFPNVRVWGRMPRTDLFLYLCRFGKDDLCSRATPQPRAGGGSLTLEGQGTLTLREGVFPVLLHGLASAAAPGDGTTRRPYLIDVWRGTTSAIPAAVWYVLRLCQDRPSFDEVVRALSSVFGGVEAGEAQRAAREIVESLARTGLVEWAGQLHRRSGDAEAPS